MGSLIGIGRVHTVLDPGTLVPTGEGTHTPSVSICVPPPSHPPSLPHISVKHILAQCPEVCLTQFGPAILPRSRLDSTWGRIQIKQILHCIEVLFIGLYCVDT